MSLKIYKQSIGGGEISPSMYSRITDPSYSAGLAKCRNMIVEPQGPVVRRPGSQWCVRPNIRTENAA